MAPKKFTYTPGTGGGKQTKAFAAKGKKSQDQIRADRKALEDYISGQVSALTSRSTGTSNVKPSGKMKYSQVGMGNSGFGGMRIAPTKKSDFTPKRLKKSVPFALEAAGIPVEEAGRIVTGKGDVSDAAMVALSVLPYGAGKVARVAAKGVKKATAPSRVAYASTPGLTKAGKTATAVAADVSKGAARRTKSESATIAKGTKTARTEAGAAKLEKQAAKEQSRTSITEGPKSSVEVVGPTAGKSPVSAAAAKKFGSGTAPGKSSGTTKSSLTTMSPAEKAADRTKRSPAQRAMAESDLQETMKFVLGNRGKGARAGGDIPGELGARRVGGPSADAATAAPLKPKAAPKPGPKQALREKAKLTAEPVGKPKVPSARASQAVKDKYAADLAAYEKQQATFESQQAAIKQKTTDIEMGKAKGPSAKETGSPMVAKGKAKNFKPKKPAQTKAPTKTSTEKKPLVGKIVPSTQGPQAPGSAVATTARTGTGAGREVTLRPGSTVSLPKYGTFRMTPGAGGAGKPPLAIGGAAKAAGAAAGKSKMGKVKKALIATGVTGATGVALKAFDTDKSPNEQGGKGRATASGTPTEGFGTKQFGARNPEPGVYKDKYGRSINKAEYNRRKVWWNQAKNMSEAEFKKAYDIEVKRRREYIKGEGTREFGAKASTISANKGVPVGVSEKKWASLSASQKQAVRKAAKANPSGSAYQWLKSAAK